MEYLTQTEVAKRLGLSRSTVYLAIKAGKLQTLVVNKRVLVAWKDGAPVQIKEVN